MNISYAILVNDEYNEIKNLINILLNNIDSEDEIVVVQDLDEYMECSIIKQETWAYLTTLEKDELIVFGQHPLNENFSKQKNYLNSLCTKDYIFNLDADEYILPILIENIKIILEENKNVDAFWVPRINLVHGITIEDVNKWRWNISKLDEFTTTSNIDITSPEYLLLKQYNLIITEGKLHNGKYLVEHHIPIINWPYDPQLRLYKNNGLIKWTKPVHELLTDYNTVGRFPNEYEFSIIHEKTIDRQRKQNAHYDKIISNY